MVRQLEAGKRCFERVLAWPSLLPCYDRVVALSGMALYHKVRKECIKVISYSEEALKLIPESDKRPMLQIKGRLLILLADAAEGQGDMVKAHEYDDKAKKLRSESNKGLPMSEAQVVPCFRREAIMLLAAGRPRDAVQLLTYDKISYVNLFTYTTVNIMASNHTSALIAALKVLADTLEQTCIHALLRFNRDGLPSFGNHRKI